MPRFIRHFILAFLAATSLCANAFSQVVEFKLQQHEGEHLFAVERLVVSPASGVFTPQTSVQQGDRISIGQTLGTIGETPVVSVFEGILQSFIAVDGERVTLRQPIAWLRTI